MLPWIFAVLLVLNLALFAWGYLGDQVVEPVPPPVPEGPYEIQLLSEVRPGANPSPAAGANETPGSTAGAAASVPAVPQPSGAGGPVRHTETALGRAMVPAGSGTGETADSPSPAIPTIHLSPDPAASDQELSAAPGAEPAAADADPAESAPEPASGGEANSSAAPAASPDRPDAEASPPAPPQRHPLPDPDPPAPGNEDAPREAAV